MVIGSWTLIAAVLVAAAAAAGCGRKGPPLAPIVRVPAAVQSISAQRRGNDAYVTVTVPAQNIDSSTPADLTHIDVYGYTGLTPPARGRFLERATMIATIPVEPVPRPGEPEEAPPATGAQQGSAVVVRDPLMPDDLVPIALPPPPSSTRALAPLPGAAAPVQGPLRRFYLAIPFNGRRPGPQGAVAELVLTPLPDPPAHLEVSYSADAATLRWEPSGGLLGFLLDNALPIEPPPFDARQAAASTTLANLPNGPTQYKVYREIAPDPRELVLPGKQPGWADDAPAASLNAQPVAGLTFNDPIALDERERCYVVRAVRGAGAETVEGEPSPRQCVNPIDVFPPALPAGLDAVADAGSIRLLWEPNTDGDLAGYLILRGEAGSATLTRLTPDRPIAEAQFVDDTVVAGVRYVYEVVAVDGRVPLPNVSAPARIEVTAR